MEIQVVMGVLSKSICGMEVGRESRVSDCFTTHRQTRELSENNALKLLNVNSHVF